MAAIRGLKQKELPAVSTASLPDIIFILLFFFMVVTKIKDEDLKVFISIPEASEAKKLTKKTGVSSIFIGTPVNTERWGTAPRLQLENTIADHEEVGTFVEKQKLKIPSEMRGDFTIALKIDRDANMGLVTDVKTELRKAHALRIVYVSIPVNRRK